MVIDPRSYRRYDAYADAVGALDARGTARLYATLKPRIQDAYRELGETGTDFDRTFERAIRELLKTPVIDGTRRAELEDRLVRVRRSAPAVAARRPAAVPAHGTPKRADHSGEAAGNRAVSSASRSMYS